MSLSQIEKDARKVDKERAQARREGKVRVPQNIALRPPSTPPMVNVKGDRPPELDFTDEAA